VLLTTTSSQTDLVKTHNPLRLSKKDFFMEKQLSLTRACRKLEFANEVATVKLLEELETLHEATRSEDQEMHSEPYNAQQALALTHVT
jgi:hypothetical protein